MKKLVALILAVACVIGLLGCNNTKQEEEITYYFSGEHDYFTISNCSIIMSDTEQKFDGGELTITQPSIFKKVTSYSTCFYTLRNGERDIFHSTTAEGLTGDSVPNGQKLGKASSTGLMISNLEQGLWFELITMDANGTENTYQIELTLTK